MESRTTDEQAVHTAKVVAVSHALAPAIACFFQASPTTGQATSALAKAVFHIEVLQEMTNVFSIFMNTCVNTNHIKASFCLDVAGIEPRIFIATNQAYFGENAKGLERSTATIEGICKLLAGITPENAHNVRGRVLAIVAEAAWPRIGRQFGLSCQAYCGDESDKTVKIPEFLPDKLLDITKRLAAAKLTADNKYGRLMEDTKKLDRTLRTAFQIPEPPTPTARHPEGTKVKREDRVKALEAVDKFYKTNNKLLEEALLMAPQVASLSSSPPPSTSTPPSTSKHDSNRKKRVKKKQLKDAGGEVRLCETDLDLIRRFENICLYVDGVSYLCNVALGHVKPGRATPPNQDASRPHRKLDNASIIDWFSRAKVVSCMLEQEAFHWSGEPDRPQCSAHAAASAPGAAERSPAYEKDQSALDQDQPPESPSSPAPSIGARSEFSDDVPQPTTIQDNAPTLLDELNRQGLHNMYRAWLDRKPPRKDSCKNKSRKKTPKDEATKFVDAYNSALGQGVDHQPKIHAEIILLLKVEELMRKHGWRLGDDSTPSIYIASSKKACYFCHKLILASNMNVIAPPTHSNVYALWRLPNALYLEKHAPTATEWPTKFCKRLWDITHSALSSPKCWEGDPPARHPSEDIELCTFPLIGKEAYGIGHWATPASPTAVCDTSLHTTGALTLDPKTHKRPADASTLGPVAHHGKRVKGKLPAVPTYSA